MLELDPQVVAATAVASAGVAVVALVLVVVLGVRVRRLRRRLAYAFGAAEGHDLLTTLGAHGAELDVLRGELDTLDGATRRLGDAQRDAVSRIGVVRYDAFDDMGGALSFSAALLDDRGDGLVVSAINGRSETRCYAKPVRGSVSEYSLSPEERSAIEVAVDGREQDVEPIPARRRRRPS